MVNGEMHFWLHRLAGKCRMCRLILRAGASVDESCNDGAPTHLNRRQYRPWKALNCLVPIWNLSGTYAYSSSAFFKVWRPRSTFLCWHFCPWGRSTAPCSYVGILVPGVGPHALRWAFGVFRTQKLIATDIMLTQSRILRGWSLSSLRLPEAIDELPTRSSQLVLFRRDNYKGYSASNSRVACSRELNDERCPAASWRPNATLSKCPIATKRSKNSKKRTFTLLPLAGFTGTRSWDVICSKISTELRCHSPLYAWATPPQSKALSYLSYSM